MKYWPKNTYQIPVHLHKTGQDALARTICRMDAAYERTGMYLPRVLVSAVYPVADQEALI